ncbi:hypothetical protein HDU83_002530 [Entophlyctis luteolus]|nr:hypothetical protein HDU83_002530 [Entophlyctis luteolus]
MHRAAVASASPFVSATAAAARVAVLGAGCIGLLHAHHLQQTLRVPVKLLLRGEQSRSERVVRTHRALGPPSSSVHVADSSSSPTPALDLLLVCTKATDASTALAPLLRVGAVDPARTVVVMLLNGALKAFSLLAASLPSLVLATTTYASRRMPSNDEAATIAVSDVGETVFGLTSTVQRNAEPTGIKLLREFVANSHHLTTRVVSDPVVMRAELLLKLAVNCALNPVAAVVGCRNGRVSGSSQGITIIRDICREALLIPEMRDAVAARLVSSKGGRVDGEAVLEDVLVRHVISIADATADNVNSMDADLQLGRPSEIDFLNGHLVEMAQELNCAVPRNRLLIDLVKLKEASQSARMCARDQSIQ